MNITDLGGHSGCKILLCEEEDNTVFVRKISSGIEYNDRLEQQALKQKNYKNNKINKPEVLNMGKNEAGLFYFDMEYIQGLTLAEFMKTAQISEIRGIVESIVNGLTIEINVQKSNENGPKEIFENKILKLKEQLNALNNEVVDEALSILSEHDWGCFTPSFCHGDLTLENIIVKDNTLYLIDFLDSFYNSWILDIGTLLQDAQVMWSYRKEENIDINTVIRLIVFRDVLIEMIHNQVGKDYVEIYYALLLKLIRIYPYTSEKLTYDFLNEKTEIIIELIRSENR